ncbi:putative alcohol dehydrogenase [Sporormia fimetaria CBS 119925]|uniref:Alcohol dehydrogenase n=1 Tax=Sporormia fimetaria CBS 119925 TaxID=1340428 RepID=A0A6A6V6P4_9PLEO|nr:putative alcohol dehydrogenase [Sporormia fimetaria CBS 119925]
MSNQAAWIKEKHANVELGPADKYTPGDGELLVKVEVIGFNPIEAKIQKFAMQPIPYPNILGISYAGTIDSVGPNTPSHFTPGTRVAVNRTGRALGDARFGSFQKYALAQSHATSILPASVSLEAGAASICNLATVTCAMDLHFSFSRPSLDGSKPAAQGKTILIYGGTSSVGGLAISYAKAAGYRVVTTTSPQHAEYVASLNPDVVIDHKQSASAIVEELKKNGPYDAIFDTIGLPPVTNIFYDYLGSVGGGKYNTIIPPIGGEKECPEGVQRIFAPYSFALDEEQNLGLRRWYYEEFVPKGLEAGIVAPSRPETVEGGLEGVQEALDRMIQGRVSGRKLVAYPWKA